MLLRDQAAASFRAGTEGAGARLTGGAKELRSVVGLFVFEHAEDGVQEFAHDGDEGLHFQFASGG